MRISELSAETGVAVATLKYYLREKLLHPGEARSRTQADYDESHVERVRLVRALTEAGGLSLAAVARVLEAIERPDIGRLDVLGAASRVVASPTAEADHDRDVDRDDSRARRFVAARDWQILPDDPALDRLDAAWAACDAAGIGLDEERLGVYADAAETIAAIDVDSVPADPHAAVRQVVLGTVLVDPVLAALRRLAQAHLSVQAWPPTDDGRATAE